MEKSNHVPPYIDLNGPVTTARVASIYTEKCSNRHASAAVLYTVLGAYYSWRRAARWFRLVAALVYEIQRTGTIPRLYGAA